MVAELLGVFSRTWEYVRAVVGRKLICGDMKGTKEDDVSKKQTLEVFDGTQASEYRRWRRRAELYLQGLPTTVPEKKWGARLMEHLAGEAEELMEQLPIEKIIDDDGYKNVLSLLDDKYKELDGHELQRVLKEYFYGIVIKPQETYRNFIIRLDTSYRAMLRHKVQLPDEVKGWFLLRKLSLDATSEAMIMTSSGGSVKYEDVVKAVKAVYPNGKCGTNVAKTTKEIFLADPGEEEEAMEKVTPRVGVEGESPEEVMEIVAAELQEQDDYDSEDALEAYETYVNVKQRVREKKVNRGYKSFENEKKSKWSIEGTVKGKIELLKQKTKCHICRRTGHWKKECPLRKNQNSEPSKSTNKEVHIVEEDDDDYLEAYLMEETMAKVEVPKPVESKKEGNSKTKNKKDFWEVNESAGTVTRVHVKPRKSMFTPHNVADIPVDVNKLLGKRATTVKKDGDSGTKDIEDDYKNSAEPHANLGHSWTGKTVFTFNSAPKDQDQVVSSRSTDEAAKHLDDALELFEADVLRGGVANSAEHFAHQHASLEEHAVPDTACRKTLVGEYTLRGLESKLNSVGLKVLRYGEVNDFKFGNAGVLRSQEVAKIPVRLGSRTVVVHAAVLPGTGSQTPFLLSKELLKHLGCVLDTDRDVVVFKKLRQEISMGRTEKGHYAIPIIAVDKNDMGVKPSAAQVNKPVLYLQECHESDAHAQDVNLGTELGGESGEGRRARWDHEGFRAGCMARRSGRRTSESSAWTHHPGPGQVQQAEAREEHGRGLCDGQALRGVGEKEHPSRSFQCHHEEVPPVRGDARPDEDGASGRDNGTTCTAHGWTKTHCATPSCSSGQGQELHADAIRNDISTVAANDSSAPRTRGRRMDRAVSDGRHGDSGVGASVRRPRSNGCSPGRVAASDQLDRGSREGGTDASSAAGDGHEEGSGHVPGSRGRLVNDKIQELLLRDLDLMLEKSNTNTDVMIINLGEGCEQDAGSVAEVFSVPRVAEAAQKVGLKSCGSYDLLLGHNLLCAETRKKIRERLRELKPKLLIICPPCETFSPLQHLRKNWFDKKWLTKRAQGRILLRYGMTLLEDQVDRGDIGLFEHPKDASSWEDREVVRLRKKSNMHEVVFDQCRFGLKDRVSGKPHKKRYSGVGQQRECS